MAMSDQDKQDIAEIVVARLREDPQYYVPPEQHKLDHDWASRERVRQEGRSGMRRSITEKIVGTIGAIAILAALGWLGRAILDTLSALGDKFP